MTTGGQHHTARYIGWHKGSLPIKRSTSQDESFQRLECGATMGKEIEQRDSGEVSGKERFIVYVKSLSPKMRNLWVRELRKASRSFETCAAYDLPYLLASRFWVHFYRMYTAGSI